jgi:putative drug exporter of the RND superfamily
VRFSGSSAGERVAAVARSTPEAAGAYVGDTNGTLREVDAMLRAAPGAPGAFSAVDALRAKVDVIPGAHAVVGGPDATTLDSKQARARDRLLIIPLVLGVIVVVLILLLRALVAPGVLKLIALTQIGVIVGIGVLPDTLLVRTVLVPAQALLDGERFRWPGRVVGHQRG